MAPNKGNQGFLFIFISPVLEARAEIEKIVVGFFEEIEDKKNILKVPDLYLQRRGH